MYKSHSILLLLFLIITLSGCNFHLRGPMTLAKPLQNVYVQSQNPYGDLTRNLKQYLKMSGVHLAANPEEATTILNISQEASGQNLLSINSSQQTRQYSLNFSVTFEILDESGQIIVPAQTVIETRPLTLQSNQVLAGSNQAAQLYQDMRRAIVYSMMARLASKEVTSILETASLEQTSP